MMVSTLGFKVTSNICYARYRSSDIIVVLHKQDWLFMEERKIVNDYSTVAMYSESRLEVLS